MKRPLAALGVLLALGLVAIWQRHVLLVFALSMQGPPPLVDAVDEGPNVRWFDDYFTIEELDPRTFAIGEPRYAQANYSYLLLGRERAVLFDAGPGVRDIRPVAESLTSLPVTFLPSHFHYDHLGNQSFEDVAVVDLPYLRERAPDGRLRLLFGEHLGMAEGIDAPTLEVDTWLPPGSKLSLGDRELQVLYTPGHTQDSISLLDVDSRQLFSGDFLYPGPLFAFVPGSNLGDYQQGAESVLRIAPEDVRIFGAHRAEPPGAPELAKQDLADLAGALGRMATSGEAGEGVYPVVYSVNERIDLLAEPRWLQEWEPSHPELECSAGGC